MVNAQRGNLDAVFRNAPACLRDRRQWVAWKYVERDGKPTKAPVNPLTGGLADSTDPATWGSFDEAVAAWQQSSELAGIGFVFSQDDPYCGVDLDDALDPASREIKGWGVAIIDRLASYTEVSPSGTGVKAFIKATKPGSRCRKAYADGEVEIYDRDRFFTVTGLRLTDMPPDVELRQEELESVYVAVFGEDGKSGIQAAAPSSPPSDSGPVQLDDDEIIRLASSQRRSGQKFATLWAGNWNAHFNSASEADSSVVFTLAFYTKDAAQIDRLFRQSGLMRPKWDELHGEQTYGETTIAKALAKVTKQYSPKRKRKSCRPSPPPPKNPGLPSIVIDDTQLNELTDKALAAVIHANTPPRVFVRAGNLARVVRDENGLPKIEPFDRVRMRCRLSEVANFFTLRKGEGGYEQVGTNPPLSLAENVLAQTAWNLPPLAGLARAPILRHDGTICTQPGYDPVSRLVYSPDPNLVLTAIPPFPTTDEVQACVDILLNVIRDFPFADDASRANALAILFTLLMRPVLTGCVPLAIIDAPVQGTGKSLLVTSLATIAVGNVPSESIPTRDNDEEWRKKITSILLYASPFVHLDNIPDNTTINSPSLAAALTTAEWSDRILGRSEIICLPSRSVWAATGNNLRVTGDLPRRSYSIRLDANEERPWTRTGFKIKDLKSYVPAHRGNLLSAALTIIRGWYTNGKPIIDVPALGSFEQWASTVGSVLAFAGVEGFLSNLERTQLIQDDDTSQWTAFFDVWWDRFGEEEVTADRLARLILPRKDASDTAPSDPLVESLPEPLLVNRDRGEGSLKRSIGRNLSRLTGRIFERRKLCAAGEEKKRHVRKWRLKPMVSTAADELPTEEFV
jgi:hypothetical protein